MNDATKRRGRPPKGATARTQSATAKLTETERQMLREAAERLRRTESDLMREWIVEALCELG